MPTLVNRQAMRALFHALPSNDDEVAYISWGPHGFTMRSVDSARASMQELNVYPGAFVDETLGTEASTEYGVDARQLRGALQACIREDQDQVLKVELRALSSGIEVILDIPPNEAKRKLGQVSETLASAKMPTFDGKPIIPGLSSRVLYEGLTALSLLEIDYVNLFVDDQGVLLEAVPDYLEAQFRHNHPNGTKPGKCGITIGYLKTVGDYGASHNIHPKSLEVALIPERMIRFRYSLDEGQISFWVAARLSD